MKKTKFVVLGAFLLFAVCAFFFGQETQTVQADTKNEILKTVASYKNWQQVNQKPDGKSVLQIDNSSLMG